MKPPRRLTPLLPLLAGTLVAFAQNLPEFPVDPELPDFPDTPIDPASPSDPEPTADSPDLTWPETDAESRPWLRWWWPADGTASEETAAILKQIETAGFGGVEILPTASDMPADWPGPGWPDRCSAAARICEELGIGFDLATQSGPSPEVPPDFPEWVEHALDPFFATLQGGEVDIELPNAAFDCLGAWPIQGPPVDLLDFIDTDAWRLRWIAPPGTWNVYGTPSRPVGNKLNPFSPSATAAWLERFDETFVTFDGPTPRSRTLERTVATSGDWSEGLYEAFQKRRGYDLREQLPILLGDADPGLIERVVCDYRETLAEMHYEALLAWHEHTRDRGSLSRSLLAGNPGHPVDLHSVADIPGTLISSTDRTNPPIRLFFASSAAHLAFKPLVQGSYRCPDSEPLTPERLKTAADLLWLAGANQLILDGRSMSTGLPKAPLDPGTGLWRQIDSFTGYATRCQNILQSGAPDPDVLLYFPAHDFWVERGGLPDDPVERERWLETTPFHRTAEAFLDHGVTFDFLSDRLLKQAVVADGRIIIGGLTYRAIILPEVRRLPETTAALLLELSRRGAKIGILGEWPRDVPGYPSPDIRRGTLISSMRDISPDSIRESHDPLELAIDLGVSPETMAEHGLRFVRRSHFSGRNYFVVNRSDVPVDRWIPLSVPAKSVLLLDPRFPERTGTTRVRKGEHGSEIRIVLGPGESRIIRTFENEEIGGPSWKEFHPSKEPMPIAGIWNVEFLEGGPELPDAFATPMLGSWNTLGDPRVGNFTGMARYTIEFDLPDTGSGLWQLDLGGVAHSARIHINGFPVGTAFAPPHRFDVGPVLKQGLNTLSIETSNLLAAKDRADLPSGLLGPVRLFPMIEQVPEGLPPAPEEEPPASETPEASEPEEDLPATNP
ncbi:glycosyl hydrolase family 2 [Haloferula helveola]|uniref:Glycosyl hydrolase family 2 n=1 Tax=Haloferula helveola TaxID=490095 RepID=A0ABN6HAE1_9BACT|nr:glycosyl hydrolase family 2 [Haloferula helveola]